ncbi:hypothetical protein CPC16_008290 [Podila verticillata]|nr:hypothetical protein CPC16_008290 [Podila verticillata]
MLNVKILEGNAAKEKCSTMTAKHRSAQVQLWRVKLSGYPKILQDTSCDCSGDFDCDCGDDKAHKNQICRGRESPSSRAIQRSPGAHSPPLRGRS